jgi:putative FmdB family regulatory protein
MPLYEYECYVCSNRFERIQRVSDDPVKVCPECGGAVRRLLGAPALQFKGSGWYVTDYGKGNGSSSALAKTEEKESTSGTDTSDTTAKKDSGSSSTSKATPKAKAS